MKQLTFVPAGAVRIGFPQRTLDDVAVVGNAYLRGYNALSPEKAELLGYVKEADGRFDAVVSKPITYIPQLED